MPTVGQGIAGYRGEARTTQPRLAARRAGVPLFMCNAQYPTKSMDRDAKLTLRHDLMRGYAVNRLVNSVRNDTEACIEPIGEPDL